LSSFCPVSGCNVFSRPEWINRNVSDTFIANFWVIGNSIIYSLPRGRADLEGVRNSIALNCEVAKFVSGGNGPYVQIEDYAAMNGASMRARRYFANSLDGEKRLKSVVFCNLSTPLAVAVKLGRRFYKRGKYIQVAQQYGDAIKQALKLCDPQDIAPDVEAIGIKDCFDNSNRSLSPIELVSEDAWKIETPEFTNRSVLIDGHILYSIAEGFLEGEKIPLIDHMRHLCQSAIPEGSKIEYIVVDSSKLRGGSRAARFNYMKSLRNWHKQFPFQMYIVHGANTFMRTALHLARPLMPFQVKIAKDKGHAFRMIRDNQSRDFTKNHEIGENKKPAVVTQTDIENVLSLIGSINWEMDGIDNRFDMDADHPFYYLYQSIKLIKEELDDLIKEHQRAEEALIESKKKIIDYSNQTEQLSLAAASMLSIQDEQKIFHNISKAIVEHSDYSRVIISLFKDKAPFRDIIGFGGVGNETIERLRTIELPKTWYDGVFKNGEKIGRLSYYIPHTQKQILNQEATVFGKGPPPASKNAWHPEDNLFVRMNNNKGEFIGVISVDESKSGLKPSSEIVRPLEIFSSLISQIIILNRTHRGQRALQEELKQAHKMESIGTLTGGIAHDFNNILYMITGNAELALEDIPEWSPAHANLKEIKAASLKAAGIVKQLLNFSRRTNQELKPIGAISVVKDTLKFLRSTIPATIEIRILLPDTDVTILADPIQINQVMMNLCMNASQAMSETGGILKIKGEILKLKDDAADGYSELPAGDTLQITVSDTGPGINPEVIDRIFDPYFTTKAVGKGSGMGLAVVHGIIKNHNGTISVASEPGKGTTFAMRFSVIVEKPVMGIKTSEEIPRGHETILFVDDEKSIVDMTQKLLERLGYKVESKLNPMEALALFESKPDRFDLAIIDMTMPQMTGVKLSEKMKAVRPDIPVIICSGYSSQIDEEKAKKLGIASYTMKPIVRREFAKTIREVLDRPDNEANGGNRRKQCLDKAKRV